MGTAVSAGDSDIGHTWHRQSCAFAQSRFGFFWLNCNGKGTAPCLVWGVRRVLNGKTVNGKEFLKAGVGSTARPMAHRAVPGQLLFWTTECGVAPAPEQHQE